MEYMIIFKKVFISVKVMSECVVINVVVEVFRNRMSV